MTTLITIQLDIVGDDPEELDAFHDGLRELSKIAKGHQLNVHDGGGWKLHATLPAPNDPDHDYDTCAQCA